MAMKEIKYEIVEHVADIGEPDNKGWIKEVNIMLWGNSKKPVIDIRSWNRSGEEVVMGKGITFSLEAFKTLQKINTDNLTRYFED